MYPAQHTRHDDQITQRAKFRIIIHRSLNSLLIVMGYILSPLSWWNDIVVNIPLAYMFSVPVTLINKHLFLPAFVVGYFLTNLVGFILLHRGFVNLANRQNRKLGWARSIAVSVIYISVIVLLTLLGYIKPPSIEMFEALK